MRSEIFCEIQQSRRRFLYEAAAAMGMTGRNLQQIEPVPPLSEMEKLEPTNNSKAPNISPAQLKTTGKPASQRRLLLWNYLLGFFSLRILRGSTHYNSSQKNFRVGGSIR